MILAAHVSTENSNAQARAVKENVKKLSLDVITATVLKQSTTVIITQIVVMDLMNSLVVSLPFIVIVRNEILRVFFFSSCLDLMI